MAARMMVRAAAREDGTAARVDDSELYPVRVDIHQSSSIVRATARSSGRCKIDYFYLYEIWLDYKVPGFRYVNRRQPSILS